MLLIIELVKDTVTLIAPTDFQLKQLDEIFRNKLAKRQVDSRSLEYKNPEIKINEARQQVEIKQGIDPDTARKIVKLIKETNIKVQASIQGDQVRVTGKKRDELQSVIAMLRNAKMNLPLQFENFRD